MMKLMYYGFVPLAKIAANSHLWISGYWTWGSCLSIASKRLEKYFSRKVKTLQYVNIWLYTIVSYQLGQIVLYVTVDTGFSIMIGIHFIKLISH